MEAKYFFSDFEPIQIEVVVNAEYVDIEAGFIY